jgi:hypothetical protein
MITFKWLVEKVVTTGDTNIVTNVYWRCDAKKDELTASCSGIRSLVLGDTFIPYGLLTEQQVLDWCFAPEVITLTNVDNTTTTITKHLKDESEAQVTEQIERQLAKKASEPALPWVTTEA